MASLAWPASRRPRAVRTRQLSTSGLRGAGGAHGATCCGARAGQRVQQRARALLLLGGASGSFGWLARTVRVSNVGAGVRVVGRCYVVGRVAAGGLEVWNVGAETLRYDGTCFVEEGGRRTQAKCLAV